MTQNGFHRVVLHGVNNDTNAILLEKVLCPGPHPTGNHKRDALLGDASSYHLYLGLSQVAKEA